MMRPIGAALVSGLLLTGCGSRASDSESGPAPIDSGAAPATVDTAITPDTGVATPPITPPQSSAVDTPPAAPQNPGADQPASAPKVSRTEYEGWRQYSVNCARCHGQDVLPNPVAANLLVSVAPGGPIDTPEKFGQVVSQGRPHRGMPAFQGTLSPEQIQAMYAYVRGRAEKRIPPGRPAEPAG
jgi:mono/diheme cytochrome c family protein